MRILVSTVYAAALSALCFAATVQLSKQLDLQANQSATAWRAKHKVVSAKDTWK